MGAKFTEFIGEMYIPFKPIKYQLYKISEKLFKTFQKNQKEKYNWKEEAH